MLFVIYGVAANCSISDLFATGFPAGFFIAFVLLVITWIFAKKKQWPVSSEKHSAKEILIALKRAWFSILAPVLVFAFIAVGICTATEAAAIACVLELFVGVFVYKKITWQNLKKALTTTTEISGAILIISSMGGVLGWNLSLAMIPQAIAEGISAISDNPLVVLLIIQLFLFFVGMVMDSAPAVMILVPVFAPIMTRFGFDPVHFGLLMTLNLSIGLLTPPVGTVLYTTAASTGVSVDRMIRCVWPWVAVLMAILLVITVFPETVMWLPHALKVFQ